ncbi:MAG: acyl-CoA synthetase [Hyphomicrobiaceae bacterium]|nr:acyl-CoA synthetase [Hyphomicrobiaceae bacterium]
MKLTELSTYADAQRHFSSDKLWALLDGTRERLNLAHECIDRHATSPDRIAVRIAYADGHDEHVTFERLKVLSSHFAHFLKSRGVVPGDRVAIMLEPSLAFYAALFGAIKAGAIAVPLFTLFGPDGLRLRIDDCTPKVLLTNPEKAPIAVGLNDLDVIIADDAFMASLAHYPAEFTWTSKADDLAVFQYTSGTTRELPDAVRHTHRAIVVVLIAALYGTGIRPGEEYFCPSSPAWGHGLWHGTLAPLALGLTIGTYSGRFDADRLMRALQDYRVTNLSAAATHYRMMRNAGTASRYTFHFKKLTFTGEPMDSETTAFAERTFGLIPASFYGTTEVGVVLASYPGAPDLPVKAGALGKPLPGGRVEVHGPDGRSLPPREIGEIMVLRRDKWIATKDLGWTDEDGYFYHGGRADDVIISAGWTMSAVEIEDAMLKHPDVAEAAAIGVPDATRGRIVKAFVVSRRTGDVGFVAEIQEVVRARLSAHEYPRQIAFVAELPKTPAGKVNRKVLREREAAASPATKA